ncbi:pyruvate dehydrogenase (acetyl-transferring) E1 component subunit alpha, partial [Mycoplasmopsis synoviae]
RTEVEEKEQEVWEPMHRIEKYLLDRKLLTKKEIGKIWADSLEVAKKTYEESVKLNEPTLDEVFDYTYAELTPELKEQKQEALDFFKAHGGK